MKFSITIVLLAIASCAFAQNNNSDSRSTTKIDENERKRLEDKFKALNTFYINDYGLVVYQTQGDQTSQSQESDRQSTNEESPKPQNTPAPKTTQSQTVVPDETQTSMGNRANTSAGTIRKEAINPSEETIINPVANQPRDTRTVKNSSIETQSATNLTSTASTKVGNTIPPATTTVRKSIFDKKPKPTSQFRTLEEAALAVEDLLDELRREQAQTTSAGSMSSRLSGGAGRSTLRKKPATDPMYDSDNSDASIGRNQNNINNIIEEEVSPFGNEPTYYINGKEVERAEVNRLRRREIISKEVRTRNTASGNPNGEVWYEVRYEN